MDEEQDLLTPKDLKEKALDALREIKENPRNIGTSSSNIDTSKNVFLDEPIDKYTDYISKNGFRGNKQQINDQRAENQGAFEAFGRGLISRSLSIIPKVGQGIGHFTGFLEDAGTSIVDGELQFKKTYDNAMVEAFSKMDEELRQWLPIYATRDYTEGNLMEQMTTAKFWADDAFDGIAFMVSAMAPGGAVGSMGKAVNLSSKAMKWAQVGVGSVYNTVTEAGFEAHGVYKSVKQALLGQYDEEEASKRAAVAARNTFLANAAVLMAPNVIQSKFFHGNPLNNSSRLRQEALKGKISQSELNGFKEVMKGFATGFMSEGVWEENIQTAIQNWEESSALKGDQVGFLDSIEGYTHEYLKNFTTNEGWKSIILGGIIGGPMGAVSSFRDLKDKRLAISEGEEARSKELSRLETIASMYEKNNQAFVDENGNINDKAVINLIQQTFRDKDFYDQATAYTLANNQKGLKMLRNMTLGRKAFGHFESPIYDNLEEAADGAKLPLQQMLEDPSIAEEDSSAPESINADLNKIDSFKDLYSLADSHVADINEFDPNDIVSRSMSDIIKKNLYHQYLKRETLQQLQADSSKPDVYTDAIEENNNLIKKLEDPKGRSHLIKEQQAVFELESAASQSLQLAKTREEKSKASYELEEIQTIFGDYNPLNQAIDESSRVNASPGMIQQLAMDAGSDAYSTLKLEDSLDRYLGDEGSLEQVREDTNGHIFRPQNDESENAVAAKTEQAIQKAKEESNILNLKADSIRNHIAGFPSSEDTIVVNDTLDDPDNIQEANEKVVELRNEAQRLDDIASEIAKAFNNRLDNRENAVDLYREGTKNVSVFRRVFAEKKFKAFEAVNTLFNRDKEEFSDVDRARNTLDLLKAMQSSILPLNSEEDFIWEANFKGLFNYGNFVKKLSSAIDKLENSIIPTAEKNRNNRNAKQQVLARYDSIINYRGVGVFLTDSGVAIDEQIAGIIKKYVPSNIFDQMLETPEHNVRLELIKSSLNSSSIDSLREDLKSVKVAYSKLLSEINVGKTNPMKNNYRQYLLNPEKAFVNIFNKATPGKVRDEQFIKTPVGIFTANKSLPELLATMDKSTEMGASVSKEELGHILNIHSTVVGIERLRQDLSSSYNHNDQLTIESKLLNDSSIIPTSQQTKAIRDVVKWYKSPHNVPDTRKGNWAYLQGIAGTGKTTITLNWAIKSLGIDPKNIVTLAHNDIAALNISNAVGSSKGDTVENFLNNPIVPPNTEFIVIDEVNALQATVFEELSDKLALINSKRDNKIKILVMGDPTQIRGEESHIIPIESLNLDNEKIRVIEPLTIPYRTDVAPINDAAKSFQNSFADVKDIITQANAPIGTIAKGVHIAKQQSDIVSQLAASEGSGRTRVIVVTEEEDKLRYNGIPNVRVMTYIEVQGLTIDEVYIDLDRSKFKVNSRFNSAMYTSIARASTYSMIFDRTGTFSHSIEDIVDNNADRLKQEVVDNRQRFVDNNNFEREVMGMSTMVVKEDPQQEDTSKDVDEEFDKFKEKELLENKESTKNLSEDAVTENPINDGDVIASISEQMKSFEEVYRKLFVFAKKQLTKSVDNNNKVVSRTEIEVDDSIKTHKEFVNKTWPDGISKEQLDKFFEDIKTKGMIDLINEAFERSKEEEVVLDEEVRDDTGENEDGSVPPTVEPLPEDIPEVRHRLKFPQYSTLKRMDTNSEGVGQKVVYVREKASNGGNRVGIYLDNGNGKFDRLGIVSNEELDTHTFMKKKFSENNTVAQYRQVSRTLNSPKSSIIATGVLENAAPMTYVYSKETTKSGEGTDKFIESVVKPAFDNELNSTITSRKFKIFTTNDEELKEINEKNVNNKTVGQIKPGIPYMVFNLKFNNSEGTLKQFIRVNPRRLSKTDDIVIRIRKFYDAVKEVDSLKILKDGAYLSYGDPKLNTLLKKFKANFELVDKKVVRKTNDTFTYKDAVKSYPDLTNQQFNTLNKLSDVIIPGYYGYTTERNKYTIEDYKEFIKSKGGSFEINDKEIIDNIVKSTNLTEEQANYVLEYPKRVVNSIVNKGKNGADITPSQKGDVTKAVAIIKKASKDFLVNIGDTAYRLKDDGNISFKTDKSSGLMTTDKMFGGRGDVQKALNNLVTANNYVGSNKVRFTRSFINQFTGKTKSYSVAKEILSEYDWERAYAKILTEELIPTVKALKQHPEEAAERLKNTAFDIKSISDILRWIGKKELQDHFPEIEKFLQEIHRDDLYTDTIKADKDIHKFAFDTEALEEIVGDENFDEKGLHRNDDAWKNKESGESGESSYLRVPLNLKEFNDLGSTQSGRAEISKLIKTNLITVNPTFAVVRFTHETSDPSLPTDEVTPGTPPADTSDEFRFARKRRNRYKLFKDC